MKSTTLSMANAASKLKAGKSDFLFPRMYDSTCQTTGRHKTQVSFSITRDNRLRLSLSQELTEDAKLKKGDTCQLIISPEGQCTMEKSKSGHILTKSYGNKSSRSLLYVPIPADFAAVLKRVKIEPDVKTTNNGIVFRFIPID